jgi:hypothetical protein
MPRSRLAPLLLLVLALPACDYDLVGPPETPPDANLCATPPEGACGPGECEAIGGCVLYTCDPATGETVQVVCESPPAAIDGTWSLRATLEGADPCPEIARVDDIQLRVVAAPSFTTAAVLDGDGQLLDTASVSPQFGQTGVRFTLHPIWSGPEGLEVPAHVEYDLTVYSSGGINGRATATATSGDATCTYDLDIDGDRE